MLSVPAQTRIFLALEPVDMRKQHNGLWAEAQQRLREDPFSGALFLFSNRSRNRLKILYWDGSGVWVFAKRLEKGSFSWPQSATGDREKLALTSDAFQLLLCGVDLKKCGKKAWYER